MDSGFFKLHFILVFQVNWMHEVYVYVYGILGMSHCQRDACRPQFSTLHGGEQVKLSYKSTLVVSLCLAELGALGHSSCLGTVCALCAQQIAACSCCPEE